MVKKIIAVLIIIAVSFTLTGLFAANYIFDKYLARPEVIEELVNGISQDLKSMEINKKSWELIEEDRSKNELAAKIEDTYLNQTQKRDSLKKDEIKVQKNNMENIDKKQNMDNNVKGLSKEIKINPADKTRVIEILKSSLTNADIQELKKLAVSKPLTAEKIARAKAILKAGLTKQQKNELKMIYRKYYGG